MSNVIKEGLVGVSAAWEFTRINRMASSVTLGQINLVNITFYQIAATSSLIQIVDKVLKSLGKRKLSNMEHVGLVFGPPILINYGIAKSAPDSRIRRVLIYSQQYFPTVVTSISYVAIGILFWKEQAPKKILLAVCVGIDLLNSYHWIPNPWRKVIEESFKFVALCGECVQAKSKFEILLVSMQFMDYLPAAIQHVAHFMKVKGFKLFYYIPLFSRTRVARNLQSYTEIQEELLSRKDERTFLDLKVVETILQNDMQINDVQNIFPTCQINRGYLNHPVRRMIPVEENEKVELKKLHEIIQKVDINEWLGPLEEKLRADEKWQTVDIKDIKRNPQPFLKEIIDTFIHKVESKKFLPSYVDQEQVSKTIEAIDTIIARFWKQAQLLEKLRNDQKSCEPTSPEFLEIKNRIFYETHYLIDGLFFLLIEASFKGCDEEIISNIHALAEGDDSLAYLDKKSGEELFSGFQNWILRKLQDDRMCLFEGLYRISQNQLINGIKSFSRWGLYQKAIEEYYRLDDLHTYNSAYQEALKVLGLPDNRGSDLEERNPFYSSQTAISMAPHVKMILAQLQDVQRPLDILKSIPVDQTTARVTQRWVSNWLEKQGFQVLKDEWDESQTLGGEPMIVNNHFDDRLILLLLLETGVLKWGSEAQ